MIGDLGGRCATAPVAPTTRSRDLVVRTGLPALPLIGVLTVAAVLATACGSASAASSPRGPAPSGSGATSSGADAAPAPTGRTAPDMAALIASKTAQPVWSPAPPAPGEKVYPGFGVRTLPAPPGTTTSLSAADALATSAARTFGTGGVDVELRLVTTGDVLPVEGVVTNRIIGRAAWVPTFSGVTPIRGGPPGADRTRPVACADTVIIDTRTGAEISVFQECGPA